VKERPLKSKVRFGIVVVSDRIFEGKAEDYSGEKVAKKLIEEHGHTVTYYTIIPNKRADIGKAVERALKENARIILFIGGTGLGPKDVTADVVESLVEKKIPGFGELFRYLTFIKEGTKAWLTRATAGTYKNTILIAIPGSPSAVKLALKEIILPEICHVINVIEGVSHWDEKRKSSSNNSNICSTIRSNNNR